MTYDDKVQWLRRFYKSVRREEVLAAEVERLRSEAERMTPLLSSVPGGGGNGKDRLPKAVEQIVQAQQELVCQINCTHAIRRQILDAIAALPAAQHDVLRRKYILCQGTREIAAYMHYSEGRIYQLHRDAVNQLKIADNYSASDVKL